MTEWNDGRLDDLSKRVDKGFADVDRKFEQVNARIDRVDDSLRYLGSRLDGLQLTMARMAWTYGIGMLAFAAALLGLIAAKF